MIIKKLPKMMLYFYREVGAEAPSNARHVLHDFLKRIGQDSNTTKTYFFVQKKEYEKACCYYIFARAEQEISNDKQVKTIHIPASEYLTFNIEKNQFDQNKGNCYQKILASAHSWAEQNNRQFDTSLVPGLIEEQYIEGYYLYNIYLPLK